MKAYKDMNKRELKAELKQLRSQYEAMKALGLRLDMSRGKPCIEQLDLSLGMMDVLSSDMYLLCEDGTDCRNYGVLDGITEAKALLGDLMEVPHDQIIICGNSSLNVMYDTIARSFAHGVLGHTPWSKLDKVKFLCVVPGYDRHFAITEFFGCENVPVPMLADGPDMDMVEELIKDPDVKGIWCTPKYSNPTGNTYSDEVVKRFARLQPAAPDFRIYWDNAYTVHHLYDDRKDHDHILEIVNECEAAGNPDIVYKFASTSKITFPGSGIAMIAGSHANIEDIKSQLQYQTIGFDKINQLRHVRYFGNVHGIKRHMKKHAAILRPKFEMVENILEEKLGGLGIAEWTNPKGGYFISFDGPDGCAKEIVSLCREAGVKLTEAGATFPGGNDPRDRNIRIAPSFPPLSELKTATELLALCTRLAAAEKYLEKLA